MTSLVVLADDLSGAAEVAGVFLDRTSDVSLTLDAVIGSAAVSVVDLDTRAMAAEQTELLVSSALRSVPSGGRVLAKIDSLLRGNVAATVRALSERGPVIVAGGLPLLNRVVRDGVLHVDGVPLADTDLWHAEFDEPPESLPHMLDAPLVTIDTLSAAAGVVVCDIESDADLDAVVAAVAERPDVILVGTSALAAAVARGLDGSAEPRTVACTGDPVLVVVGTASSVAVEQVRRLVEDGVRLLTVDAGDVLAGLADARELSSALRDGSVALTVTGSVDVARTRDLSVALAEYVRAGADGLSVDLALTGGETARAVITALGIDTLRPLGHVHYGAVVSVDPRGRRVVTRPGSFGDRESLSAIHSYLTGGSPDTTLRPKDTAMTSTDLQTLDLPVVALTMGDGAGIGPEVIVPAVLDAKVAGWCKPVVIGDAARLRLAADVLGVQCDIVSIERIADAEFTSGRINVIDLGLLPADLAWGELSAVAGHAAYEYIRVAAELAVAGDVQAICTAPLNKEALHAAGHIFPGHTELLAHLTGTEEVSMMLSTPKLKVIHVTTHIGLLDAVAKIEPGLVERTVRRGYEALVRSGNSNPKIGLCGINPHAGENGLFGYGEEDQKIVPAVEKLQADGIDAVGPLPADTAFFLAGRGDYDLIVAMYHDQGHGPVKVLGIEAGVNITVGLPVIRTSVDHGTAFDIAGKGIAEAGSMVEALRQAAELATSTADVG
ncbi:4-hydroxythreonine-4-phosphate dehydrogenase PdxA [Rhodococcus sp. BP-316]|uniref:4-hydroxythreonine-4-phosphate dehydrogenase PdxA n=1 Tax=Rhodococcus sp. BP-316 TaxID=2739445 RepID=UPI001C9AD7E5|nr:4-hydroxythreonine-4-phosphate dehydrogenase PdxA [Rhodococcus sp. BP-316]MBY6682394.1 4-hydroxythreonine-4-phosphate dehydrogenase PdxA [Rhodococcus sp. BP-316]